MHMHILWALHCPAWWSEFMMKNLTHWPLKLNLWLFIMQSACSLPYMYLRTVSSEANSKAPFLDSHRPFSFGFPLSSRWMRTISWNSEGKMKVWANPTEVNEEVLSTLLPTVTYISYEIYWIYLEDIPFWQFECPGFKLNALSRLGLDGVDAFVVVIVVHRKVGGQQCALSARDWVPTLSCKENHNNLQLTPIS